MKKIKASITAVGSFLPEKILNNADLEKIVDTNDDWITTRTGIKERRILDKGIGTSYMAIRAANTIIKNKKLDPTQIDLVIVATITPDMHATATAAYVASEIGASNAFGFDISAACSGFLYGLSTASAFIESGRYKKIILIGADKMSSIVDYTDRNTCIIFGDGAGAVLLEPNIEGYGVQDEYLRSNGSNRDLLRIEAGGSQTPTTKDTVEEKKHFIYQDGKNVFKHAVSNMSEASDQIMKRNNLTHLDVNYLIAHQANKRIIDATSKRMGIKDEKVLMNIHRYGNTTAATIPLLLFDFESKLKKGDNIIFASFGAGFTWGAMYLKWAYNH
ncbi:ketoacyl-ACP synthase III [Flavobacteriaceae bacterium]|nr:ketoacyl-ACP synthase III [Flavobacteriaceae bacterium]MBT4297304.1 ketoacyl-ACP synthase III [Flavobacteriaceae bacterium]MBT4960212.1 ketoacyl-ACP synthase III [Flavobacteriaceae bacterium]MBT5233152.1 ketoacyl-ACP synthase III [Flavobacteriaceae bacterium]MBT6654428.1 ketoacyl-ACP synthase III [Flavobacteriaceae bacterium]